MTSLKPDTVPSLLARAGQVDDYPWPHIVIPNALPEDYYWELHKTLPPIPQQAVWQENNRWNEDPSLVKDETWQAFIAYHRSPKFMLEVMDVLKPQLDESKHYYFDCRRAGNLPSKEKTKVLGPHVDGHPIWFVGLFYMGSPQDGGDLQLCRWLGERQWIRGNRAAEGATEPAKTIQYNHNVFVGFLNNQDSVHQVSDRKSDGYRQFVSILGKFKE